MIFNDYHKHFLRAGGNSTIHHKYVMIELKNGCKYIFHPKDINLSDLILNHKEYSFLQVNQIDSIYRVHTYGTKCKDNHDLQSFCVVRLGTGYYGFPMFTDTALHCSRLIRKEFHYDELHYASLLKGKQPDNKYIKHIKDTYLPLSRWIRIARMNNGMTAIMEMINNDWFPASFLFNKHAELLKVNLHINQNDLIHEDEEEEGIRFQEWNLSPESFQSLMELSPFLILETYK